ncbi:hypothetical protein CL628_02130 [bacterium]|nr:hypothetical protein [bacterium]
MASFRIQNKQLKNGLSTVLMPSDDGGTVTFLVLVGVGSRYETPRQSGLSHFLEHMFFKGTSKRPTTKEISEAVDNVGGEFNAFTSEEYTGYYVKVAAAHLNRAADVVSDILLQPLFPAEEIERERGVIIEEIKMYTENPMRHVHQLWMQALYGKHPLGWDIAGTAETVSAMQRQDFVNYTSEHYHTGNAVIAVAGNFNPKQMTVRLNKLFAKLSDGRATRPKSAPKRQSVQRLVHEARPSLDQTHLMVGVPGPAMGSKDRWASAILATVLGGGMSSRLFLQVRERRGLAYAVRTNTDELTDTGSFVTQAGVRTDKAVEALKVILEEYDRAMDEPVGEEELHKAKQMLRGQLLIGLEETNALAIFGGMQQLLKGKVMKPGEIVKQIDKVTAKQVQSLAQKLLAPKKRALALLGPQKSAGRFEKLLK